MYLVDSNIFLEVFLEQKRVEEATRFLKEIPTEELHVSEFSFYTLGVILLRRKRSDLFLRFVNDLRLGLAILRLGAQDMKTVVEHAGSLKLDFDDAYQYTVAEKYDLTIVSFDKDFNRTSRGRKTPAEIISSR